MKKKKEKETNNNKNNISLYPPFNAPLNKRNTQPDTPLPELAGITRGIDVARKIRDKILFVCDLVKQLR